MAKYNENRRKVRFDLPEPNNLHKINNAIKNNSYNNNRTNINIISKNQIPSYEKIIQRTYKPISIRILPSVTFLKSYKKLSNDTISTKTNNENYYRNQINPLDYNNNNDIKNMTKSNFTIPISMALTKSPTDPNINQRVKHLVILNNNNETSLIKSSHQKSNKMQDNLTICEYFSRYRIFEDILKQKRKNLKLSEKGDRKIIYLKPLRTSVPQASEIGGIENYLHSTSYHNNTIADLIQRLKRMRLRETEFNINNNILVTKRKDPIESAVLFRSFKTPDVVKRFGCFKMSLEREPSIPTLLRAARDADSYFLKLIFKKIVNDGITPDVLNKTDRSGRTALSYICSTDLTQYLDLLLQLKGIDVNIGDNEGNTPLHYAAQSGQAEIVNMLLTRCRSIQIDAKNCWGFTPMMKAALQGKTRCAKLLLFAGASPVATDSSRSLNAAEWARFTGRESCAEMIEKCSKARNSKPNVSNNKTHPCSPKNINNIKRSDSFFSKINKMLPFKSSIKDKQISHNNTVNLKSNITLNNISVCGSKPDVPTETLLSNDLAKNATVPKLIITQQTEVEFMKKQTQQKYVISKRRVRNEI